MCPPPRDIAMVLPELRPLSPYDRPQNTVRLEVAGQKDKSRPRGRSRAIARKRGIAHRPPKELSVARQRVALGAHHPRSKSLPLDEPPPSRCPAPHPYAPNCAPLPRAKVPSSMSPTIRPEGHDPSATARGPALCLVQQVVPHTRSQHPVNLFVGRFLGSPSMNVISSTGVFLFGSDGATPSFTAAASCPPRATCFPPTAGRAGRADRIAGGHRFVPTGDGLQRTVEIIESMGTANVVYARLATNGGDHRPDLYRGLRCPRHPRPRPGQNAALRPSNRNRVA